MPPLTKRPKRNAGPWSSPRIFSSTSPLLTKDIHPFLVTCIASWGDKYTEAEKRLIIDSMPAKYRKYEADADGNLRCPVSVELVLDDPYIKAAVEKFKNDLQEGCYEKRWQNQARKAMEDRRHGKFDSHLRESTEDTFGDDQSDDVQVEMPAAVQSEIDSDDGEWDGKRSAGARRKAGRRVSAKRTGPTL